MAQHDYVISNGTGAAVRSDLNNALLAIVSQNSGATEPTTTYAYQWWADTTTGLLKIRNSANNAWITLRELDGTLTVEDGTVSAPGLAFRDDLNTGIWRPGTDQFAISTNGIERVEWGTSEVVFNDGGTNYDFRIEGDNNANLLFVDASADAVGIGTSSPGQALDVVGTIQATASTATGFNRVFDTNGITTGRAQLRLQNSGGGLQLGIEDSTGGSTLSGSAANSAYVGSNSNTPFYLTQNATIRATIDTSGRLGIGTTSVSDLLHLSQAATPIVRLEHSTTSSYAGFHIYEGATQKASINALGSTSGATGGANALQIWNFSNAATVFATNNTERARIDSSGRLLVGTSTAFNGGYTDPLKSIIASSTYASGLGLGLYHFQNDSNAAFLNIGKSDNNTVGSHTAIGASKILGGIFFDGSDGTTFKNGASIIAYNDQASSWASGDCPTRLVFSTTADGASSPTERMRIDNGGNVMVGMTSNNYLAADSGIILQSNGVARFGGDGTSARNIISFVNGTDGTPAEVGRIQTNGSATSYLTSSDYRLKENIAGIDDGIYRLKQLKPSRFNFLVEPTKTVDGFLAHEVQGIVPEAIDGEKDAVDADGNSVYQGIDQSKLVPLLTAALQEAVAKIESLEARLTAAGI